MLTAPPGHPPVQHALLAKDSPLTACVTQAVDDLRADGTLDALAAQWLTAAGAPVLS